MQLTACCILFSKSADTRLTLDFSPAGRGVARCQTITVFKQISSKESPLPRDPGFDQFVGRLLGVASRLATVVRVDQFYGKASSTLAEDGRPRLRFHYNSGCPPPSAEAGPQSASSAGLLWDEAWVQKPRGDFASEVALPAAADDSDSGEELLRLDGAILGSLSKSGRRQQLTNQQYRVCFCCRAVVNSPESGESQGQQQPSGGRTTTLKLLCWLHPAAAEARDGRSPVSRKRLTVAALNGYLCVFERLPAGCTGGDDDTGDDDKHHQAQPLLFLAVEAGSLCVADWLLTSARFGCHVDSANRWGDTALLRCCSALAGAAAAGGAAVAFLLGRGADPRRRDVDGNSALHRLLAAVRPTDTVEDFRPALDALLTPRLTVEELADWLGDENSAGECPLALLSNAAALDHLLGRLLADGGGGGGCPVDRAARLLSSTSGFGLLHCVAAFGRLDAIQGVVVARLGQAAWQRLLGANWAAVESGRLAGYTAMHAACQEGSWQNVRHLMQLGCPPPGVDAVDLLVRERRLAHYGDFVGFLGAIPFGGPDALTAALRVLDCAAADCLTVAPDSAAVGFGADFKLQRMAGRVDDCHNPLLEILRAAFAHDSADGLRAFVQRGGSGGDDLLSWCEEPEFLRQLRDSPDCGGNSKMSSSCKAVPSSLLCLAMRHGKWRLARDLLVTRQFDLLPSCLQVMLQLQDVTRARRDLQLQEQPRDLMEELHQLAKRTFCGALHQLYRGAITKRQKCLVFNYLGGRFHSGDQRGPLFDSYGDHDGGNHDDDEDDNNKEEIPDVSRLTHRRDGQCVFDLMLRTSQPELLSLPCATDYVDRLMASPRTFCCHACGARGQVAWTGGGPLTLLHQWWPAKVNWLHEHVAYGFTPKATMLLTFLFNLFFVCLLGYYVHEVGESRPHGVSLTLKLVLLLCALSYAVQEALDIRNGGRSPGRGDGLRQRLSRYAAFRWNLVDIAAVILLFAGLISVFILDAQHPGGGGGGSSFSYYSARLVLAVSFIMYCLRLLSSLGYFEHLGLYISITKTTFLMDVVPFLIVNAFFLASFGVLIVCLLFPGGHTYPPGQANTAAEPSGALSTGAYVTEVFQRPLLAHFGEYGMDGLRTCQTKPSSKAAATTDRDDGGEAGGCPHPLGNKLYSRFVLFLYLLIVSVVLINVLIAKLSLTVSREDGRARVIWRSFRAQLLAEYGGDRGGGGGGGSSGLAPPLLLAIYWAVALPVWLLRRCLYGGGSSGGDGGGASDAPASSACLLACADRAETGQPSHPAVPWWRTPSQAPEDYKEFLWFQAMQFRKLRGTFAQFEI